MPTVGAIFGTEKERHLAVSWVSQHIFGSSDVFYFFHLLRRAFITRTIHSCGWWYVRVERGTHTHQRVVFSFGVGILYFSTRRPANGRRRQRIIAFHSIHVV